MLAALRGVRMNVPQQKQHPLPNVLAWYVRFLFVYGLAVKFAGTETAAESLSHSKQMWVDGILLREKLFARPASNHSNMHACISEATTQIEENWVQELDSTLMQQSPLGNDFSCESSPVRFGLRGGGDAAPGDAGGDVEHRRRRSVRCARCGTPFANQACLFAHEWQCDAAQEQEEPEDDPSDAADDLSAGVSKIQLGFAEEAAETKYGGYASSADVMRQKHAVQAVAAIQQKVLLHQLETQDLTGEDWQEQFASTIKTVMSATDPLMGRDAEYNLLKQQQPYQVEPVCVQVDTTETVNVGGRSVEVTKSCQTWNIPLERSVSPTSLQSHTLQSHHSLLTCTGRGSATSFTIPRLPSTLWTGGSYRAAPRVHTLVFRMDWLPGTILSWAILRTLALHELQLGITLMTWKPPYL